jgi:hypothetical protein
MSDEESNDAQPTETPLRADDWASLNLGGLYAYHRRGWIKSVRRRGLLMTYETSAFWQADFEQWASRPVGGTR